MSRRLQRVNTLIKEQLSEIILKEVDFSQDTFVTLTRVETSPDLVNSKILVSVIPKEKVEEVFDILNKNIYFLQQKLNERLKMKRVPKIKFVRERETEKAAEVEEILEKLKK